jgi:Glycosyl transferases group 1
MKILVVYPTPFFSSLSLNNYTRLLSILDAGNEVDLITFPEGEDFKHPGLNIYRCPRKPLFSGLENGQYLKIFVYTIRIFFKVFFLRKSKYDAIYTSGTMTPFLWVSKYFTSTPFVSFIISKFEDELIKWNISKNKFVYKIFRFIDTYTQKRYDYVIFQRSDLKDEFINRGLDSKKAFLIKQSVAIPEEPESYTPVNNSYFNILYTGTFVDVQNIDLILNTAKLLKDSDIRFQLIGASEKDFEKYSTRVKKWGIEQTAEIIPRKAPNDLRSLINDADILISTRTYGHDTPIKIFYYLSYGKCILATDCPIHNNVLNKDVSVLVEPDPNIIANKILELKANPIVIKSLSVKAKDYFEKEFSIYAQINNYKIFFNYIKNEKQLFH